MDAETQIMVVVDVVVATLSATTQVVDVTNFLKGELLCVAGIAKIFYGL